MPWDDEASSSCYQAIWRGREGERGGGGGERERERDQYSLLWRQNYVAIVAPQ